MKDGMLLALIGSMMILIAGGNNDLKNKMDIILTYQPNNLINRAVSIIETDPNYLVILKEKDRQIQHWQNMCQILEKRNEELAEEFKKLENRK